MVAEAQTVARQRCQSQAGREPVISQRRKLRLAVPTVWGPVLAVIGLIEGLLRWARVTANVLALFVALTMALDLHPAHAHASGESHAHNHFGANCVTPEVGQVSLDGIEISPSPTTEHVNHRQ